MKLSYENQCSITDFYNEFKDNQHFEKSVLNILLSGDKEKSSPIILFITSLFNVTKLLLIY